MPNWPFRRAVQSETKSIETVADTDDALFAAPTGPSPGAALTPSTALLYPPAVAATRLIADATAVTEIQLFEKGKPVASHPALTLLNGFVNEWISGYEFRRDMTAEALMYDAGAMAWVNRVDGEIREIVHYKRGTIQVQYEETRQPIYRLSGQPVPASDIVHLRGPFEKCPLSLAREAIGAGLAMEAFSGRFFQNGAQVGGVVEIPQGIGEKAWKKIRAGFKAAYEGPKNAGKTLFLYDGASYRPLSMTSSDSQLLELRRFQLEDTARAFGMSAALLGDLTRSSFANASQKQLELIIYVVEPWLKAIEAAFNRAFLTAEERQRGMRFQIDRDDLTRASLTERATAINSLIASETICPNEGRDWLGLAPYAGGEKFSNRFITVRNPNGATSPDTTADVTARLDSSES